MRVLLLTLLLTNFAMAQSGNKLEINLIEVDKLEEALKLGISKGDIQNQIKASKKEVMQQYGIDDEKAIELKSIEVAKVDAQLASNNEECNCEPSLNNSLGFSQQIKDVSKVVNELETTSDTASGVLFITWGYNRGFHSKSDITVETPDGKYTIKDAVGFDRPSKFSLEYLKPSKFSVPQYNLKIGYWFSPNSKFGIAAGTDHMKWIFDEKRTYEIEGYFNKPLWVNGQQYDFEEIKAMGNASFLMLEHTDGYNYPYLEGLYRESLLKSDRFDINFVAGAGMGILFPKTRTRVADRPNSGQYRDIDNKFKVAGWGAHADASLVFKYKKRNGVSFFVKPTVRGVAGKINNALYIGSEEGRISQSVIYTLEPSVSGGVEVPLELFKGKKRQKKKKKS